MARKGKNRARKRRKRRLKTSVKIILFVLFIIALLAAYTGYQVYRASHAEDPHGTIEDVPETPSNGEDGEFEDIDDGYLNDQSSEIADYWVLPCGEDGESIFIRIGDTEVLIDTGTKDSAKKVVKTVKENISGNLDYVVLTNNDKGRIGGVEELYSKIEVAHTIMGNMGDKASEVKSIIGDNGDIEKGGNATYELDEGALLTVVLPDVSSKDVRDRSLMTVFEYGDTRFIAESDAGVEEEARLLSSVSECDVLVLARHGSSDSNRIDLGERYAVASTGKNSGLPSKSVLASHSSVWTTGKSGIIKFTSDSALVESNALPDDMLRAE